MPKIDYKIDTKVFDTLDEIRSELLKKAPINYHSDIAGLALLGIKDKLVDTVVPLKISGGCCDAPEIQFKDMHTGLKQLIKNKRICIGMALIRNLGWNTRETDSDAKISRDMRSQIHTFKNSFEDIEKTIWLVLHNNFFRVYTVSKDPFGRLRVAETKSKKLFPPESKSNFYKKKEKREEIIKTQKIERKKLREEEAERNRIYLIEQEKRAAEAEKREAEKLRKKKELIEKDFKESKKEIIDIGSGFVMLKNNEGKYILWQTGGR